MKRPFAPGDEIVVVKAWEGSDYQNGDRGLLQSDDGFQEGYWSVQIDGRRETLEEGEMEHAAVVASPLWEELK